jgi:myo-inositol-1(or 4)-monophosphatase
LSAFCEELKVMINLIREIAQEAGIVVKRMFESGQFSHQLKEEGGLVTTADIASEEYILASLKKAFPKHSIVSEEAGRHAGDPALVWYVDPLDGTRNFARGIPDYCVGIGLAKMGVPILGVVYSPMSDEMFCAEQKGGCYLNGQKVHVSSCAEMESSLISIPDEPTRSRLWEDVLLRCRKSGTRLGRVRVHAATLLDLAYVAAGRFDARVKLECQPWDHVPGQVLVEEAGGEFSDWNGEPCKAGAQQWLASNGLLHESLLQQLRGTRRTSFS